MTIDRTYPIFTVRWLAGQYQQCSSSNDKPNPNHRATTQSNPNEQSVELNRTSLYWGTNGRYYWKDSSLDNRYCSRYSCDRFNRYFLLWFIFRIRFIPVIIG
ncbi:unnamed protein product [Malus baccata var. baccata]